MRFNMLLLVLAWVLPASADRHVVPVVQACYDQIQGHIAWNHDGSRRWNDDNVFYLCRGTRNAEQPGHCFHQVMHRGLDWGGGTRWEWKNAIDLCRGTSDAGATIACFRNAVSRNLHWSHAIDLCSTVESQHVTGHTGSRPATCQEWVQGRIAWNYQGDRVWADPYLDQLCRGSDYPAEPGRCYQQVMHGGIDWGGGTRWEPDNALALCAGSNDAEATIGCFQEAMHRGVHWGDAIRHCGH